MTTTKFEPLLISCIETLVKAGKKQFILGFQFQSFICTDKKNLFVPERTAYVLVDARTNYKAIWSFVEPGYKSPHEIKAEEWKFQSCHDSCWREDGLHWIFDTWCDMRDQLIALIKAENHTMNIYEVSHCTTVKPNSNFFQEVSFEKEQDPTCKHQKYQVKNLEIK